MAGPAVGTVDAGAEGVRLPEPPRLLPLTLLQNEQNSAGDAKRRVRGRQGLTRAWAAFLLSETWTFISKSWWKVATALLQTCWSTGRWGNLIYSNTSQLCKGMVILSLPTFGRCWNLTMCWWDFPISQTQVLCHDSGRKQNKLEKPYVMISLQKALSKIEINHQVMMALHFLCQTGFRSIIK